ncbi:hypothetical protein TTHERM_00029960 (macronuclear) [Tetrahymena thermophila SB210]|uniref:Transmembrane protein n=1 Tax=Tetrahymena thermophila (strain SB210) TaxID=312017 RepID=Q22MX7_TETTS|nr:hypothetical protein TTHERM_00029960 [Tetrahymena thermophila SB210]EAR86518.1 hypothetical protein TTHERM_00029960 [Tetrahymena thermophila SB210]|eukprot:XP_976893.1 hypothetical protein TTHERM_00029960 [Tetrahymena thermophila SB210]
MKIQIIILLSLCLTSVFAAGKCANHQAYLLVKAYFQDLATGNGQKALDDVNKFASYYENKNPSTSASSDDLGVCSQSGQYQGHPSCCDAKITKFLEKAALFKVKPLQNQNNIVMKFMNALVKMINKSTCNAKAGQTKPTKADDLKSNTALTSLQTLIKNSNACKIQFATAMVQFTRGAVCTVCAGTDQLSSFFGSDGKLIISQSSSDAFQKATNDALACFADVASWTATSTNPGLSVVVNDVFGAYLDSSCSTTALVTKLQNAFTSNGGIQKSGACSSTTVFKKQTNCEQAQQGDSTIDNQVNTGRFLEQMEFENIRVLQAPSADSTISSTGGVNILVQSPGDSNIDADGNVDTTTDAPGSSVINSFLLSSLAVLLLAIY